MLSKAIQTFSIITATLSQSCLKDASQITQNFLRNITTPLKTSATEYQLSMMKAVTTVVAICILTNVSFIFLKSHENTSTNHFANGTRAVPISSRNALNESLRFDILPVRVVDCVSDILKNFPHSLVMFTNACWTSLNHTFPSSTIFFAAASVTPYILASSARIGTPAFMNCLSSVPYSWFAVLTCPYAYAICSSGVPVPAATSQRILSVPMMEFASIPKARSCFAESLIHWSSKGVFFENSVRSARSCFALSADQSMTQKERDACSNLSQRARACFHKLKTATQTAATHARSAHFQKRFHMVDHDFSASAQTCWSLFHRSVAQSQTLFSAFAAHWEKLHVIAARTFQNPELMSTHTCWNIFQRTETSLSPVLTKFVSSLFAWVICFLRISISPQSLLERFESHALRASLSAHFRTSSCLLNVQRSIAILIASGDWRRFISCSDCFNDCWSILTTTSASSCSFAIAFE